MTLIVYSKGKIYADSVEIVHQGRDGSKIERDSKKIIQIENDLLFACCGPLPWPSNRSFVAARLRSLAYHTDLGNPFCFQKVFKDDAEYDRFYDESHLAQSTYLIATKRGLYVLNKEGISVLRKEHEYSWGSGIYYFAMCRKSGLDIEASYKKVSEYEPSVGPLAKTVIIDELEDLVEAVARQADSAGDDLGKSIAHKTRKIDKYNQMKAEQ